LDGAGEEALHAAVPDTPPPAPEDVPEVDVELPDIDVELPDVDVELPDVDVEVELEDVELDVEPPVDELALDELVVACEVVVGTLPPAAEAPVPDLLPPHAAQGRAAPRTGKTKIHARFFILTKYQDATLANSPKGAPSDVTLRAVAESGAAARVVARRHLVVLSHLLGRQGRADLALNARDQRPELGLGAPRNARELVVVRREDGLDPCPLVLRQREAAIQRREDRSPPCLGRRRLVELAPRVAAAPSGRSAYASLGEHARDEVRRARSSRRRSRNAPERTRTDFVEPERTPESPDFGLGLGLGLGKELALALAFN
jgi:hypothetical protein